MPNHQSIIRSISLLSFVLKFILLFFFPIFERINNTLDSKLLKSSNMTITIDTPLTQIRQVLLDKHREGRDADLELARRVVSNNVPSVNYYIGEFSDGIVDYVKKAIYKGKDPRSDMYVILSSPIQIDGTPAWHRVSLYRAYKGCSLQTYTCK